MHGGEFTHKVKDWYLQLEAINRILRGRDGSK